MSIRTSIRDAVKIRGTLLKWMKQGQNVPEQAKNRNEAGRVLGGITLLDPRTFTPQRVWAA